MIVSLLLACWSVPLAIGYAQTGDQRSLIALGLGWVVAAAYCTARFVYLIWRNQP